MRSQRLWVTALMTLVGCVCASAQAAPQAVEPGPSESAYLTNTDSKAAPATPEENPDRSPYVEYGSVTVGAPFVNGFIQFPTPPGYRYFIEQASVTCSTPSNTDVFTQAQLTVTKAIGPSSTVQFGSPVVVLERRGPGAFSGVIWSGSAKVKLISDPNPLQPDGSGALYFNIFHTDTSVEATCFATLFGHTLAL